MAQGFLLTSGNPGGDLDIYSLATDNDEVVRDAVVLALRTLRGTWYHNPMLGLDADVANLVTTDEEIRAILESDVQEMLAQMEGFTLTTVEAERVAGTRNWTLRIVGKATRLLTIAFTTAL